MSTQPELLGGNSAGEPLNQVPAPAPVPSSSPGSEATLGIGLTDEGPSQENVPPAEVSAWGQSTFATEPRMGWRSGAAPGLSSSLEFDDWPIGDATLASALAGESNSLPVPSVSVVPVPSDSWAGCTVALGLAKSEQSTCAATWSASRFKSRSDCSESRRFVSISPSRNASTEAVNSNPTVRVRDLHYTPNRNLLSNRTTVTQP